MSDDSKEIKEEVQNNEIDDLQSKIEAAQQEDQAQNDDANALDDKDQKIQSLTEALQRSMADMQNMRRRGEEDKMRFVKFANMELLKVLLPIIDNFDRACHQVPEELKENNWTKGVNQTHDELIKALDKMGVKKMKTVGQKLDPTRHEALMSGPGEKDIITEEFEPGYLYNEETLKPAKVKVGSGE